MGCGCDVTWGPPILLIGVQVTRVSGTFTYGDEGCFHLLSQDRRLLSRVCLACRSSAKKLRNTGFNFAVVHNRQAHVASSRSLSTVHRTGRGSSSESVPTIS